MKTSLSLIIILILSVFLNYCQHSQKSSTKQNKPKTVFIKDAKNVNAMANDILIYKYKVNGSIGISYEFKVKNDSIIKEIKTERLTPVSQVMPGSWEEYQKTFKVLQKGYTVIIVYENYRGKIKKKKTIEIIVK